MDDRAAASELSTHESVIRTWRFEVRPESYAWLAQAAIEVNQRWNFFNETSYKAARPFAGPGKWLTGYDLCNLSAGATDYVAHIGADTIQRVATEYAAKRSQAKKSKLRWRVSSGSKRSLGWVPWKAASIRRKGKYFRFCGKAFRPSPSRSIPLPQGSGDSGSPNDGIEVGCRVQTSTSRIRWTIVVLRRL